MVIDVHAHLWRGAENENKDSILAAMERYEIDKVYVSGLSVYFPDYEQVTWANRAVYEFKKENPGKIAGYVYVSPEHDNAVEVLKQGIEEYNLDGVKLWVSTFCDDECVNRIAEKAIDYGVPLLVHAYHKAKGQLPKESVGSNVRTLALRYPELRIIMAHLGGNCYNGIPPIRECPNVWVDYSGSLFRGDELYYTLENVGAMRILFGTDMPGSYLVNLGQVLEAEMSEHERELILYKNALELFDTKSGLGRVR